MVSAWQPEVTLLHVFSSSVLQLAVGSAHVYSKKNAESVIKHRCTESSGECKGGTHQAVQPCFPHAQAPGSSAVCPLSSASYLAQGIYRDLSIQHLAPLPWPSPALVHSSTMSRGLCLPGSILHSSLHPAALFSWHRQVEGFSLQHRTLSLLLSMLHSHYTWHAQPSYPTALLPPLQSLSKGGLRLSISTP